MLDIHVFDFTANDFSRSFEPFVKSTATFENRFCDCVNRKMKELLLDDQMRSFCQMCLRQRPSILLQLVYLCHWQLDAAIAWRSALHQRLSRSSPTSSFCKKAKTKHHSGIIK